MTGYSIANITINIKLWQDFEIDKQDFEMYLIFNNIKAYNMGLHKTEKGKIL